jgi:hypothetical protein
VNVISAEDLSPCLVVNFAMLSQDLEWVLEDQSEEDGSDPRFYKAYPLSANVPVMRRHVLHQDKRVPKNLDHVDIAIETNSAAKGINRGSHGAKFLDELIVRYRLHLVDLSKHVLLRIVYLVSQGRDPVA